MPREVTKNYTRERQLPPSRCAKDSFRTITRGKIKLVICCQIKFHGVKHSPTACQLAADPKPRY